MSEWWSYKPSDFLLFAPRTYDRLIELYNAELWPVHAVVVALALALLAVALRGAPPAGRVVACTLALAWAAIGWRFHWRHYATINWAATWFAAAFVLQAALLGAAAIRGALDYRAAARARRVSAVVLAFLALVVQPAVALALGRPWTRLEAAGIAPDPTAVLTLALLVAARRAPWWLYPLPLAWCALASLTLWTMGAADAVLPALGATVAIAVEVRLRRSG
jgi:hypothetical protein